ncbi:MULTISPECIES: LacI family DNA-binding transcriptional regulator [Massilia]|uniref:LacI family transcriptional regulator n=1 Tax=Massilia aurea TaxID=373040 RepID=A0A422QN94_9BURK|nr:MULTISPECIES: LacI family DNA-binding transcriptional regulator [Massilia]MDY0964671.1 LacI family DNA-binding transcriptional regulator [Massilia sp. CFBP9026]RNF31312.1 LacI family transcriptional regulator [Massilia aurea]
MKSSAPTIRDVAAAAQVSTATVSKYINGAQRFSPKVEAALDEAIAALGYRSNPLAKSMITGRTNTIGLSVLDINNPHFSSILKGANRVAHEQEYSVLLVDTEETPSRERRTLEDLSRRVDGMIVFSRMREHEMGWMAGIDKPLVFFGSLNELAIPTVASDDHGGAFMLAQHLRMLGHKRIAYLGFSRSRRDEERLGGIRECLDAAGIELTVHDGENPSMVEGERLCSGVVLGPQRPDAVICYNDLMALGFMKECANLGLSIPRDLSVVGFDNIAYGKYVTPALTTVDLQSERMGATAMTKLLAVIRGEQVERLTKVAPQLVLRASTQARKG